MEDSHDKDSWVMARRLQALDLDGGEHRIGQGKITCRDQRAASRGRSAREGRKSSQAKKAGKGASTDSNHAVRWAEESGTVLEKGQEIPICTFPENKCWKKALPYFVAA